MVWYVNGRFDEEMIDLMFDSIGQRASERKFTAYPSFGFSLIV
jgi:uncharacterized protein YneF (UPF0154 family)